MISNVVAEISHSSQVRLYTNSFILMQPMKIMEILELDPPNFLAGRKESKLVSSNSISLLKLLQAVDDKEFEEMVCEWAYSCLKGKYEKICNIGGTGDRGRDIVAYKDYKGHVWDNYQCKKYNHKLRPSDIWIEIAKLCYRCFNHDLPSVPQNYFFVSLLGVSPDVNDILGDQTRIKDGLIQNWHSTLQNNIISGKTIALEGELKNYVLRFNFAIFNYIPPEEFSEQYTKTAYFTQRFGILSKSRPLQKATPQEIQNNEAVYIKKILDAYSDYLKENIDNYRKLDAYPELKRDFERQRNSFFSAESLSEFSRDISDPLLGHFDKLKSEIYDGIIDDIEGDADNGFVRLKKVLARATALQITDNPLVDHLKIDDRKGICHHLANDRDDVVWIK